MEMKHGEEVDHNMDDFWDMMEIARNDSTVISVTNAAYRPFEIVQENEEKNSFTKIV